MGWVSTGWDDYAEGGEKVDREYTVTEAGDEKRSADKTCVNFQDPLVVPPAGFLTSWQSKASENLLVFSVAARESLL